MNSESHSIHKILIAPSTMHSQIRQSIVEKSNGVLGLQILSPVQFLNSFIHEEPSKETILLFQMQKQIKNLSVTLHTYQNIVQKESFLKECYRFLNDLAFYGLSIDALPKESDAQKELYQILSLFSFINFPNAYIYQALKECRKQALVHVYILDSEWSFQDYKIITCLSQQGAQTIFNKSQTPIKAFYHAINKRQEVEAVAQSIIKNHQSAQEISFTLADASYQPLIQQVFSRYKIPCTCLSVQHTSLLVKQCLALFQYCLTPDNEHILNCLDTGLFKSYDLHFLKEYMRIFQPDFYQPFNSVQAIHECGQLFDSRNLEKLQELEKKAALIQKELLPVFISLKEKRDLNKLIPLILTTLQKAVEITKEDNKTYRQINTLLQDVFPYLDTMEDLPFLMDLLEDLPTNKTLTSLQGVLVHSLTQSCLPRTYHYVVGTTQNNYPNFPSKKGIFDETYYALIKEYPSLEERYAFQQTQLSHCLNTGEFLYVSYPLGTYEGKSLECALEIEQFMGFDSIAYPLINNYQEWKMDYALTQETAHQIFLNEFTLHGSVSSLERYVNCPYSYFLRYGLSLQEPMKLGFPDSYAGTLSHYVLETLTTKYGKNYVQTSKDLISNILEEEISHLQTLFKSQKEALENVKQRLLIAMIQTMDSLQEFEAHSSLHPAKSEVPFTYEIPLDDEFVVAMHGYIDRIDEDTSFASILDYKSSIKLLSPTNVFCALQLQLLTYAMVIAKESGKEVLGAYYVSLKSENVSCSAGKLSRRKPVSYTELSEEEYQAAHRKAQRFNGWTMHKEIERLDDNGSHIANLRMNKDGLVKASKYYDLNVLSSYLKQMVQIIARRILKGEIACRPLEGACTYCCYHEICRFKGFYEDKVKLIDVNDEIYLKGEEEDA